MQSFMERILRTLDIPLIRGSVFNVAQYFPPFAPGFIRLNEILLPVDASSVGPPSLHQE